MFEQHPVPQQISSYQFRLVGDMTLKQFFQLAAGAIVGLIVYSLPLPSFFKWPLIVLAVVGGAAFAFLPIQDRPLEQWLVAFFRSIYAPTIFVWRKPEKPMVYFAPDTAAAVPPVTEPIPESAPSDAATHNMEKNEENFLSKISTMIGGGNHTTAQTQQVQDPAPSSPQPEPPQVVTPPSKPVEVKPEPKPEPAPTMPDVQPNEPAQTTSMPQTLTGNINVAAQQAQFSPEAAPPAPPTMPNLVVGQVMDSEGKIVEGAILEITDNEGRPVRALKSNNAGHFMIVTPLPTGDYKIFTESNDLKFEPLSFKAAGEIIQPIAIKAQNALPEPEPTRASWSV